ncbi:MAG: PD40 domain-containing protein [Blastocatellia bacterium]|nr:PD40 domain-containing protein [Blastocatellia bacterium]
MTFLNRNYTSFLKALFVALLVGLLGNTLVLAQDRASSDSDYVIFVSNRTGTTELFLLDLKSAQVSQLTDTGRGKITPATAANARVAAFASREGSSYELFTAQLSSTWRTRRPVLAAVNRLTINTLEETNPTLTADGLTMAFSSSGKIEMMKFDGQGRRELVAVDNNSNVAPAISPNGKWVAFMSNRGGANELWLVDTNTRELRQLTKNSGVIGGLNWSADSQRIVFTTTATTSKLTGIALAEVATGAFQLVTEAGDGEAAISPDGSRIVFTSNRSGDPELYLLNLNTNAVQRLTNNPGPDGSATFISAPADTLRRTPPSRQVTLRGQNQ